MKSLLLPALAMLLFASQLVSQSSNIQQATSINSDGAAPAASAMLDVQATDKGMLVPRMTTAQRTTIASPATGLLVFDTTTGGFWFYNGTAWVDLSSPKVLADGDGDTRIQVEESMDDDIIRFDLEGTENMVLQKNATQAPRLELINPYENTFVGEGAGTNAYGDSFTQTGTATEKNAGGGGGQNAGFGFQALFNNIGGEFNSAFGYQSLYSNNGTSQNSAFGYQTLYSNVGGSFNTAVGYKAIFTNVSGWYNVGTGYNALFSNTSGGHNVANGARALFSNSVGNFNTANGRDALYSNISGSDNTANGWAALYSNTSGSNNTANGVAALYHNQANYRSTAIGAYAMQYADNRTPGRQTFNTAIGYQALRGSSIAARNTGRWNTAIGDDALYSNTSGDFNTAGGSFALYSNTWGAANTANGYQALYSNTIGYYNTAIGYQSLYSSNGALSDDHTAVGHQSLYSNSTGSKNTAIGRQSLFNNTTGLNNTALGFQAGKDLPNNVSNVTCLGNGAGFATTSTNHINVGNTSVTGIAGQVNFTTYSDARMKTSVQQNVPGLAFISKLKPVTYHIDYQKQWAIANPGIRDTSAFYPEKYDIEKIRFSGFLAQEVEAAALELGYDFSGVVAPKDGKGLYGVRYSEFVVPLVKSVQELNEERLAEKAEKNELKTENAMLKIQVASLQSQLDKITAALAGAGIAVEK